MIEKKDAHIKLKAGKNKQVLILLLLYLENKNMRRAKHYLMSCDFLDPCLFLYLC